MVDKALFPKKDIEDLTTQLLLSMNARIATLAQEVNSLIIHWEIVILDTQETCAIIVTQITTKQRVVSV